MKTNKKITQSQSQVPIITNINDYDKQAAVVLCLLVVTTTIFNHRF